MRGTIAAAFLIGLGVCLTLGFQSLTGIGGPTFDPNDADDLNELRRITFSLSPAVRALEGIRGSDEPFPEVLEDVQGIPDIFVEAFPNLHLSHQDGSYSLYYKLSWDSFLTYDERNAIWTFDPGDGGLVTPLTKQVEQDEDSNPDHALSR